MDDQIDVQIALGLPLDLVEDLMRDERVDAVVKLRVDAGKAAAGAVVVHHQIVDAENAGVRGHKIGDRVDERFVRLRADQGIDRILCNADPGPEDEQRDEQIDDVLCKWAYKCLIYNMDISAAIAATNQELTELLS